MVSIRLGRLASLFSAFLLLAVCHAVTVSATPGPPEQVQFDTSPVPRSLTLRQAVLPTAFDTTLGTNFSSIACLDFLTSFLYNETFQSCLPISLLLTTSTGFFSALQAPSTLPTLLDQSCAMDCSALVSSIAIQLQSSDMCGDDLAQRNPIVQTAMTGLVAYDTVRRAACLKTSAIQRREDTSSLDNATLAHPSFLVSSSKPASNPGGTTEYCFVLAASNRSSPASLYPYFLPLGMPFPPTSAPACTSCLHTTMSSLSVSFEMASTAISSLSDTTDDSRTQTPTLLIHNLGATFPDAASLIAHSCGAKFASELLVPAEAKRFVSASSASAPPSKDRGRGAALIFAAAMTIVAPLSFSLMSF